jgi:hypothetical protein
VLLRDLSHPFRLLTVADRHDHRSLAACFVVHTLEASQLHEQGRDQDFQHSSIVSLSAQPGQQRPPV